MAKGVGGGVKGVGGGVNFSWSAYNCMQKAKIPPRGANCANCANGAITLVCVDVRAHSRRRRAEEDPTERAARHRVRHFRSAQAAAGGVRRSARGERAAVAAVVRGPLHDDVADQLGHEEVVHDHDDDALEHAGEREPLPCASDVPGRLVDGGCGSREPRARKISSGER